MPLPDPRPVPINESTPRGGRIAWWLENTLVRFIKRFYNAIRFYAQELGELTLGKWVERLEDGLAVYSDPAIGDLLALQGIPPSVRNMLTRIRASQSQGGVFGRVLAIVLLAIFSLPKLVEVNFKPALQAVNRTLRNEIPDPASVVLMHRRGEIDDGTFNHHMASWGYTNSDITRFRNLAKPLLDEGYLTTALWRDLLSPGNVRTELRKYGYNEAQITLWLEMRKVIPSPSELIAIATREGFDDGVAGQFGYDESFPGQAADAAEKGGMQRKWFQRLWRAHWRLPGVAQGFEMFHRKIISLGELRLLLRASDIPSFWRESLIKLSYNPVTRVDVRRMYDLGVIDEKAVHKRYLDLGYNPADALLMTQWTIAQYAEENRDLTKSDILGMYKDAVLNETEASGYLDALGYRSPDVSLMLAREDLRRAADHEKDITRMVHDMFLAGQIDRTGVWAELNKLDPPSGYIENLLELWDLEKRRRVARPSKTELRDMLLTGTILIGDFREQMALKGYSDQYVAWYETLWVTLPE